MRNFKARLIILIISIIITGFVPQKDKTPRLTKLTITEDKDACNAPKAVFVQKFSGNNLTLLFGYDDYFEKQDTIRLTYEDDTILIKVVTRNKPHIVIKNGIPETLPGGRAAPDCECHTLFNLEIKDLKKSPKYIIVNKYFHDDNLGFVDLRYLQKIRNRVQILQHSGKFPFDSIFTLPEDLRSYSDAREFAWYLTHLGTLRVFVLDADTRYEKNLIAELQKLFIKFELICPSRISDQFDKRVPDDDSMTISIKISDTKSFLFPEYNWRKS